MTNGLGGTVFNAMALYVQRPVLRFVAHQPSLRAIFEVQAALTYRAFRSVSVTKTSWGGVSGREIRPTGVSGPPSLLYLHGGGFTIGSSRTHRWLVARVAAAAGRVAFVPDYRLAPKHPFPAAVNDAEAVFDALSAEGPVAVAGDSAGGCLALGLCATRTPVRAALLSPLVDLRGVVDKTGQADFSRELLLPEAWVRRAITLYLGDASAEDPRGSPILYDFADAPPVLIQAAEGEMLEPHAHRIAEALPDATLRLTPNVAHVWQLNAGWVEAADAAVAECGAFLRAS